MVRVRHCPACLKSIGEKMSATKRNLTRVALGIAGLGIAVGSVVQMRTRDSAAATDWDWRGRPAADNGAGDAGPSGNGGGHYGGSRGRDRP